MAIRIRSLQSSNPTVIPLNSGQTVRLSAGEVSGELPDVEVTGNAKVEKLRRQGVIDIEQDDAKPDTPQKQAAPGGEVEPGARPRKPTEPSA